MTNKRMRINGSAFWAGFFFLFGYQANPFLKRAREIKNKSVDERLSDSWKRTGSIFNETYHKEIC